MVRAAVAWTFVAWALVAWTLMVWACVCALLAALAGSAAAARTKKLRRLIAAMTYRFTVCPFIHSRNLGTRHCAQGGRSFRPGGLSP